MIMRPSLVIAVLSCLVILNSNVEGASTRLSRPFWEKPGYFGGSIGFVGTGKIRIGGFKESTQPGFTFGAKVDVRFAEQMFWGISFDVHRLYIKDTGQYFLDVCFNVKKQIFSDQAKVGFRPGVGIGFGHLMQFRDVKSSTFLTTRATFEIIFYVERQVAWIIEVGFLAAPVGGNKEKSIKYGPVPMIRFGAMF